MPKANRSAKKNLEVEVLRFREYPIDSNERDKEILAYTISVNALFFNGDTAALIPHLRDSHCMSFEQIDIGITEIRACTGDCLENWEKFY